MNKLIVVGGATATGKSKFAVSLAKVINGEIISADSMQIYKYMNIATAKPTTEEMQEIPHYMIDEIYPDEQFSVAEFQKRCKDYIKLIYNKGKIPILVGGTGFYINAVVNNNTFTQTTTDEALRNQLFNIASEKGNEFLHNMLKQVDEEASTQIHFNNVKRVVRAIEFFRQTGEKISVHNKLEKQKESYYDLLFFILNTNRQSLYSRIEQRCDEMLENGLVDEVQQLLNMGYSENLSSMKSLGYKEITMYLKQDISLEQAVCDLKKATRHYAKRQLTWFKNQTDGLWVDALKHEEVNAAILKAKKHIGMC